MLGMGFFYFSRTLICLLALLPVRDFLPAATRPEPTPGPGMHKLEMVLGNGGILRYGLFVPARAWEKEDPPLILALHYGGRLTPFYGYDFMALLLEPAFRRFGALVVAPDCPGPDWTGPETQAVLLEFMQRIRDIYPYDQQRLVVCGFSMGGRGAWNLLIKQSDLFSAAIVLAAPLAGVDLDAVPRVPVYLIHGASDEIIPPATIRAAFRYLQKKKHPVKLAILPQTGHYSTAAYVPALAATRNWLRGAWKNRDDSRSY